MKSSERSNTLAVRFLDYLIMVIMSVFCLKYITYDGRPFAETSVQFSFLNFPVFVGEFMLLACLSLFLIRMVLARESYRGLHGLVMVYFVFVILKAVWGYMHWGPLALRDSALFYYVIFAVFGTVCFRPELFNRWMTLIFYAAVLWLAFDSKFNEYWLMPRIFMGLLLAWHCPNRWVGLLMASGVLVSTPYDLVVNTSRSVIVGNFLALSFLAMALTGIVDRKIRVWCVFFGVLGVLLLGAYMFYFSGSKPAQGLFAVKYLKAFHKEMEEEIERKKSGFKKREVETVQIYKPNVEPVVEKVIPKVETEPVAVPVVATVVEDPSKEKEFSTEGMKLGNSVFRLLLWKDAWNEILKERRFFGIDFGKPFRSQNLEIVRSAVNEWQRDGWIAMHNSYLNIIYRAGVIGVACIVMFIVVFIYMARVFLKTKSVAGLLMCASLIVPFLAANFAVTLELPYTAIPIWSLFGLTLGYAQYRSSRSQKGAVSSDSGAGHARSDRP